MGEHLGISVGELLELICVCACVCVPVSVSMSVGVGVGVGVGLCVCVRVCLRVRVCPHAAPVLHIFFFLYVSPCSSAGAIVRLP